MLKMKKKTIGDLLKRRVKQSKNDAAIGSIEDGVIHSISFESYYQTIEALALGISKIDIKHQKKVCILSNTRKEWHLLDMAFLCSGLVTVPIYPSYTSEEIEYILKHSEAELLIVENNKQMSKFLTYLKNSKGDSLVKTVISIEAISPELIIKLPKEILFQDIEDLKVEGTNERQNSPDLFETKIENLNEQDIATIVYTSGTTGKPKGAIIKHIALCQVLLNIDKYAKRAFHKKDRLLTFLPLSHVLGRCESFFPIIFGLEAVYAESMSQLIQNIKAAKPTLMVGVPRVFEKIHEKVLSQISESSLKQSLFQWASEVTDQYYDILDKDKTPSAKSILEYQIAKKLVFSKIYQGFGGRLRYFISGGAPLNPQIMKFLRNASLTTLEGYGLTETVAPACVNPLTRQVPGSVGQPIGDVQIKFADDGEILIKSLAMFSGYYKDEDATKEVMTRDSWFKTGDIGKFNEKGFLFITDRKKDIIITSGGKNIAPQALENKLKNNSLISQPIIIGNERKYLTALIGIEKSQFLPYFKELGIEENCEVQDLANHPAIIKIIEELINKTNKDLASFETIKKFKIIPVEINESNYLTPSMKIKRKLITQDFQLMIDAMYHS